MEVPCTFIPLKYIKFGKMYFILHLDRLQPGSDYKNWSEDHFLVQLHRKFSLKWVLIYWSKCLLLNILLHLEKYSSMYCWNCVHTTVLIYCIFCNIFASKFMWDFCRVRNSKWIESWFWELHGELLLLLRWFFLILSLYAYLFDKFLQEQKNFILNWQNEKFQAVLPKISKTDDRLWPWNWLKSLKKL